MDARGLHSPQGHSSRDGDDAGSDSDSDLATIFRQRVLEKHKSVNGAFDRFKEADDTLSRKAFKSLVGSLGMSISDQQRKMLRKEVAGSKAISFDQFSAFMARSAENQKHAGVKSALAELPSEVPSLPAS